METFKQEICSVQIPFFPSGINKSPGFEYIELPPPWEDMIGQGKLDIIWAKIVQKDSRTQLAWTSSNFTPGNDLKDTAYIRNSFLKTGNASK